MTARMREWKALLDRQADVCTATHEWGVIDRRKDLWVFECGDDRRSLLRGACSCAGCNHLGTGQSRQPDHFFDSERRRQYERDVSTCDRGSCDDRHRERYSDSGRVSIATSRRLDAPHASPLSTTHAAKRRCNRMAQLHARRCRDIPASRSIRTVITRELLPCPGSVAVAPNEMAGRKPGDMNA